MRYTIALQCSSERVNIHAAAPGGIVVFNGQALLPHEAAMIADALTECAERAEDLAASFAAGAEAAGRQHGGLRRKVREESGLNMSNRQHLDVVPTVPLNVSVPDGRALVSVMNIGGAVSTIVAIGGLAIMLDYDVKADKLEVCNSCLLDTRESLEAGIRAALAGHVAITGGGE